MDMVGSANLRISVSMETTCGALLRELEHIWTEIGESEAEKDQMLLELERECMQVYQRKVEKSSNARARLHQSVAVKEAEVAALMASLGDHSLHFQAEKKQKSLKEQLALITPLLEDLRSKKEERVKHFTDLQSQIEKITSEVNEYSHQNEARAGRVAIEEHDLSVRRLNEYEAQLHSLQKEKSERLHKVMEYVNEVHSLCGILGEDFESEVHPSLRNPGLEQSTNISNKALEALAQSILKLKSEKNIRIRKLQQTVESLLELWNLMDSPDDERRHFDEVMCVVRSPYQEITHSGVLSSETIEKAEAEVVRLTTIKAGKMKELVLKKRLELEEICRRTHIEPDTSTVPEKSVALIDSGLVNPSELLANIEEQIVKAKQESTIRKEIMDQVGKWIVACEEEKWLDEYDQDENRYSAGRGAHLSLKRAEKARLTVGKIPAIIEGLMSRIFLWEDERKMLFLYDGERLASVLEEYRIARQQKEEEKRRMRDHKKLQSMLLTEKEAVFGSKPSAKRSGGLNKKSSGYNGNGNGFKTPIARRVSVGSANTPELLTPRSASGRRQQFREMRRFSTTPLNFVSMQKDDYGSSFASISGSEPGSPPHY